MWALTLLMSVQTSCFVETHRSVEQPELQGLAEIVAHGPVLDHLAVLKPPDVDLFAGEFLAGRLPAQELSDVPAVHEHSRDELVPFADLVLDLEAHRPPELTQPADGLLEALGALWAAGWRLVIDEPRMDQLLGRLEIALLE